MFAQQFLNGLMSGAVYALFALGFTLMFGVLGVINLTYGFYFSMGAFLALGASSELGAPIWAALLIGALGSGIIAIFIDALLLDPLRRAKAPELASLMVTLGATLLLYSVMTAVFGTQIRRFPSDVFAGQVFEFGSVRVTLTQILIVATAGAFVAGLALLLQKTKLGLAVRALAENDAAAQLMGVNATAIVRLVSFISGVLGGAAGVLIGLNSNAIEPYMGEHMMLKAFAVIILGGLGNIQGAVFAGLLLGLLETMVAGYLASSLKDAVGFGLLVLTLWFRPVGLFGKTSVKRA